MKVLGGAGGGALWEGGQEARGEASDWGGGGGQVSSPAGGVKSYAMLGNFFDRNCWSPALES